MTLWCQRLSKQHKAPCPVGIEKPARRGKAANFAKRGGPTRRSDVRYRQRIFHS